MYDVIKGRKNMKLLEIKHVNKGSGYLHQNQIFYEKKGRKNIGRPEFQKALDYLREGDKLVVYKLDRLARSSRDLHNIIHDLQEKGIGVVFIKEQIDFSTPAGKLIFTMLGAIAEFERDLIAERTTEGRRGPRPRGNIWVELEKLRRMYND